MCVHQFTLQLIHHCLPPPFSFNADPLPTGIVPHGLNQDQLFAPKYGLRVVAPQLLLPGTPLSDQLLRLKVWSTELFRFDRPDAFHHSGVPTSWKNVESYILETLGFCWQHCPEVKLKPLGLEVLQECYRTAVMRWALVPSFLLTVCHACSAHCCCIRKKA